MAGRSVARFSDDEIIARALKVLETRARYGEPLNAPEAARHYFRLRLAGLEHELFCAAWLDSQNRVLAFEEMFRGTISQTSVYPREVVKSALRCNAAAVIFAHNHPSGLAEASRADELLTAALKSALQLVDVKVLDHLVIGGDAVASFAERGLI